MVNQNDDILINLIRQKDKYAYDKLVEKYTHLISFWVGNYHNALITNKIYDEDVIQKITEKLPYYIDEYDDKSGFFGAYMKMIVEREVIRELRIANNSYNKAHSSSYSIDELINDEDTSLRYSDTLASTYYLNEPASNYDNKSKCEKIFEYVNKLKNVEQRVFYLYLKCNSHKKIAAALEIDPKKVDNILFKIKKKLADFKE